MDLLVLLVEWAQTAQVALAFTMCVLPLAWMVLLVSAPVIVLLDLPAPINSAQMDQKDLLALTITIAKWVFVLVTNVRKLSPGPEEHAQMWLTARQISSVLAKSALTNQMAAHAQRTHNALAIFVQIHFARLLSRMAPPVPTKINVFQRSATTNSALTGQSVLLVTWLQTAHHKDAWIISAWLEYQKMGNATIPWIACPVWPASSQSSPRKFVSKSVWVYFKQRRPSIWRAFSFSNLIF